MRAGLYLRALLQSQSRLADDAVTPMISAQAYHSLRSIRPVRNHVLVATPSIKPTLLSNDQAVAPNWYEIAISDHENALYEYLIA